MPSPGMTARVGLPVSRAAAVWAVSGMRRTLVVVRTLAAAVSQVKRGLDGDRRVLRAAGVLRVVGRGAPGVGIHLVHRSHSYVTGWVSAKPPTPRRVGKQDGGDRPGPAAGRRACGSRRTAADPPRRRWLRALPSRRSAEGRKAGWRNLVNAEHRDEVASLSGLAAAVDKYEYAPHDGATVRLPDRASHAVSRNVSDREMSARPLGSCARSDRLGDLMSARSEERRVGK